MKPLPIGVSDFKKLRENNFYYVDKTLLIKDILDKKNDVLLLPRPRRFGKTLNMSMLYYFFSNSGDNSHLFKNTAIAKHPDAMKHQGQYPVIFLSFKDVKVSTWEDAIRNIAILLKQEFDRHYHIIAPIMTTVEHEDFSLVRTGKADLPTIAHSLKMLAILLQRFYNRNAIILLDEYDAPIHAAYQHGYYPQMVEFIRNFFSAALKDNSSLEFGVLTGILRTAKEGIFSGLNNLRVCSVLHPDFSRYFGFTEQETDALLHDYELQKFGKDIREWYNGYNFAGTTVYNPWSIINCVQDHGTLIPYWANTSDNALLLRTLARSDNIVKIHLETLLQGKPLRQEVDEALVFPGIEQQQDITVWSLLLFSGYLTTKTITIVEGKWICDLALPNKEVALLYKQLIKGSFNQAIIRVGFEFLCQAIQDGDGQVFEKIIREYVLNSMSMFDLPNNEPEKSYHLFVLGLLVTLSDTYEVISNRESGFGRYDIMLVPKDIKQRGIIIEFKKVDGQELEDSAQQALQQIRDKAYATQMRNRGVSIITAFGIAFKGKEVLLKQESL